MEHCAINKKGKEEKYVTKSKEPRSNRPSPEGRQSKTALNNWSGQSKQRDQEGECTRTPRTLKHTQGPRKRESRRGGGGWDPRTPTCRPYIKYEKEEELTHRFPHPLPPIGSESGPRGAARQIEGGGREEKKGSVSTGSEPDSTQIHIINNNAINRWKILWVSTMNTNPRKESQGTTEKRRKLSD